MTTMRFLFLFLLSVPCFAQRPIDVQHYRFNVELSDQSDAINATATITVNFLQPAAQLQLDLISGQEQKGMYVASVKEGSNLLRTTHQNDVLTIYLGTNAKAGEVRTFAISYMGTPADGLIISKNRHGERTFFSDHWPNRARHWLPVNDVPSDKASSEFVVTTPGHYRVVSNGVMMEEKIIDGGRKQTHWKETQPLSTKIMAVGAARFAVKRFTDSPPRVPVSAWVYPQDSTKLFYDYAVAPSIVTFFSDYLAAPFPFSKLANVQSTTIFGGMENAGAIFYSEDAVSGQRRSVDLLAHEIAHQWFGNMVSEKSFSHLWLSEGFATFLTNLYIEQRFSRDSARQRRESDRGKVIRFLALEPRPVVDSTSDLMSLLNANSYQKGGWILQMLRNEVGDTAFRKVLQTFYQRYKGANADTRDFEAVTEEVSGKELTWFFDQWLYRPGLPELKIQTKVERGEVKVKVEQGKTLYRLPLEIALTAGGKTTIHTLLLEGREGEFKWKGTGNPKVSIDPDRKVLFKEVK